MGFAWDVTGHGNTVVRGGGGIIYETVNWESFLALNNSLGISTIPTGGIINAGGGTAGGSIAVGTINVFRSIADNSTGMDRERFSRPRH